MNNKTQIITQHQEISDLFNNSKKREEVKHKQKKVNRKKEEEKSRSLIGHLCV